jgi:hypothetical protein
LAALPTFLTSIPVEGQLTVTDADGPVGTGLQAGLTADALFGLKQQLRPKPLGFWIRAPFAVEGTSLKKYQCSNTWSIMDGKPLHIENDTFLCHNGCSLRGQISNIL